MLLYVLSFGVLLYTIHKYACFKCYEAENYSL